MATQNIYDYGSPQPLPERIPLRAGPLSLIYEQGDLRYIKLGDREIVRRIYAAVRDRNWGTILPVLSNVQIEAGADSFTITYDVVNQQGEIDFVWQGKITGDAQGTITFSMDGEARSTLWRNRIGFCILHPIRECAGARCAIERVDGSIEHSTFPRYIAPHQPFIDMQAISHEVLPDVWAEVRFAGDTFEMEDQRNWIDASYKTYCTPLRLPYPVEIQQGTRVSQSITLSLHGQVSGQRAAIAENTPVTIALSDASAQPLPRIGLGSASHGQPLTATEIERLKALNLSHLRVDLPLSQPDFIQQLQQAADQSRQLGVPLEVALLISPDSERELQALVDALSGIKPNVWAWQVFSTAHKATPEALVKLAHQMITAYDPTAQFGTGTNIYFTELNRNRPTPETLALADFINYSANPQVHAFDNASLSETCEALPTTIDTARQFTGGKPISISPITLKMRFNPDATGPESPVPPGELPRQVDPRQMSLFGASWTLCSLKSIAESGGVHHVTFYETTGWRGVMEIEAGSPLPDKFPSVPGGVFPLYHVLANIGDFAGGQVRPITSSDSLRVDGMLLTKNDQARLLLTNSTDQAQEVCVSFGSQGMLRVLDETTVEQAVRSPETFRAQAGVASPMTLTLRPFATARLDFKLDV